jgi:spore maturation protein B
LWKGLLIAIVIISLIVLAIVLGIFQKIGGWLPFSFKSIIAFISIWTIPFLLLMIPLLAMIKKVKVYEVFVEGAKEGFQVAIRIIPFLVAILAAIAMFRASGAMDFFTTLLAPITNLIGMPAEILPAALMRPLSGSGTLGIITELLETHGPDSFIGNLGSTIYGCTETTFYVIAVYFGAVGIKKTRFAIPAGLFADAVGVLAALFICRLLFL